MTFLPRTIFRRQLRTGTGYLTVYTDVMCVRICDVCIYKGLWLIQVERCVTFERVAAWSSLCTIYSRWNNTIVTDKGFLSRASLAQLSFTERTHDRPLVCTYVTVSIHYLYYMYINMCLFMLIFFFLFDNNINTWIENLFLHYTCIYVYIRIISTSEYRLYWTDFLIMLF